MTSSEKLNALSKEKLIENFQKLEEAFIQEISDKQKILLIAKPFFDSIMNIDVSKMTEISSTKVMGMAMDIWKLLSGNEPMMSWKNLGFGKKEEKAPIDFKRSISGVAKILSENGIQIPLDKAMETTEDDLNFIKLKLETLNQ
jgi:hypothetical protein